MPSLQPHAAWNPWPVSIVVFFSIATAGCVAFVAFCNLHPADLVATDYYEQEIRFQQRMDSTRRARDFGALAAVHYLPARKVISVSLPPVRTGAQPNGSIHLYRPSSASLDRSLKLEPGPNGTQEIDASNLQSGLWRVKILWMADGVEYFIDKQVRL